MPNIRHELLIAAPAGKVFDAITSQQGLSAWWTPKTSATAASGTVWRFGFGGNYFKEMRVMLLEPSREVIWECITGTDEWVGTTLRFSLDEGEKEFLSAAHPEIADQIYQQGEFPRATVLSFSHDGWREHTPMFGECNYTWGQFLRGLKELCESGTGRPWPRQHHTNP